MITRFKIFERSSNLIKNQIFEIHGKTEQIFFKGHVYVSFDENEGKNRNMNNGKISWNEEKQEVLNMLKEHFDIEKHMEKHAMEDNAWAWILWFYNSFGVQTGVQLDIITTPGWHIDEKYNQISGKELLEIGLENLESYFTAKKYNL